jgi:hypothetical protein
MIAQLYGIKGMLIYSDPADDGYAHNNLKVTSPVIPKELYFRKDPGGSQVNKLNSHFSDPLPEFNAEVSGFYRYVPEILGEKFAPPIRTIIGPAMFRVFRYSPFHGKTRYH